MIRMVERRLVFGLQAFPGSLIQDPKDKQTLVTDYHGQRGELFVTKIFLLQLCDFSVLMSNVKEPYKYFTIYGMALSFKGSLQS